MIKLLLENFNISLSPFAKNFPKEPAGICLSKLTKRLFLLYSTISILLTPRLNKKSLNNFVSLLSTEKTIFLAWSFKRCTILPKNKWSPIPCSDQTNNVPFKNFPSQIFSSRLYNGLI